jgi:hypothetical protein
MDIYPGFKICLFKFNLYRYIVDAAFNSEELQRRKEELRRARWGGAR